MLGGRRVAYYAWIVIGQYTSATQMQRAVSSLYALTGSFDRIGGNRVRRDPVYQGVNARGKISKGLGICIVQLRRKAPYKIRGLMAFGTNPPVSQADIELSREALTKVEFHLHRDLFETPAAQYADIFLPVTTPWEHEGIRFGFEITDEATALVQLRRRMVPPRGGSTLRLCKRHAVTFSRSRRTPIVWTSTKGPILNFVEGEGLSLPSGCRVGQCESYAVDIVLGLRLPFERS
jgi:anaerobic selenocysteine-containing dehydrogenase